LEYYSQGFGCSPLVQRVKIIRTSVPRNYRSYIPLRN